MRFRYGIEHELAILRDGEFADFTDLTFDELQAVVDALPFAAADYPDLRVGDQGAGSAPRRPCWRPTRRVEASPRCSRRGVDRRSRTPRRAHAHRPRCA